MTRSQTEWGDAFSEKFKSAQPWLLEGQSLSAVIMPSADKVGRLFPLLATVKRGVVIQALYDQVYLALSENWLCDTLAEGLLKLSTDVDQNSGKGWYLPDENYLSLPHPLEGNTDVLKVFIK